MGCFLYKKEQGKIHFSHSIQTNKMIQYECMSKDLLVNLYQLDRFQFSCDTFRVIRLLTPNIHLLEDFIAQHFGKGWVSEIKAGCYKSNPTVFVAIKDDKIIGFAGYDCTAKGFFGPTGVAPEFQGKGVGKALLLTTLLAMREDGYGYAIIGGGEEKQDFYIKNAGAILIEQNASIYSRLL